MPLKLAIWRRPPTPGAAAPSTIVTAISSMAPGNSYRCEKGVPNSFGDPKIDQTRASRWQCRVNYGGPKGLERSGGLPRKKSSLCPVITPMATPTPDPRQPCSSVRAPDRTLPRLAVGIHHISGDKTATACDQQPGPHRGAPFTHHSAPARKSRRNTAGSAREGRRGPKIERSFREKKLPNMLASRQVFLPGGRGGRDRLSPPSLEQVAAQPITVSP